MIKKFFLIFASTFTLAGCIDRVSSLGSDYYADTVGFHTITRADTGFMQMRDTLRPFVSYQGLSYNITNYSPLMIIGKVSPNNPAGSNENIESWGLIKFNPIVQDSVNMITKLRLLLKDVNYSYGDNSNSNVNFQVWIETNNKVNDSTNFLTNPISIADMYPAPNNKPSPVGSIDTTFDDVADQVLPIPIDTSVIKDLTASSLAFVITPNQPPGTPMTNARGFGTTDNGGNDASSVPMLECTLGNGSVVYESPSFDEHYVNDMSAKIPGDFTLRGGTGAREHITLDLNRPGDSAKLTQFTTINSAILVLHLDPNNTRASDLSFDTTGPAIVQITGNGDTAAVLIGFGTHDTDNTMHFQIRGLIEDWLRSPVNNFGFELRSGFVTRIVGGIASIGLEDNTLNRWTFYGQNCTDLTKRPQLILTYSNLH